MQAKTAALIALVEAIEQWDTANNMQGWFMCEFCEDKCPVGECEAITHDECMAMIDQWDNDDCPKRN